MITVRPGSQVHRLLSILSYCGEIPMSSIRLLGCKSSVQPLIQKLTQPQEFRLLDADERITTKMLVVNGKGRKKTIRLYKGALPILERIAPDAYDYYMQAFQNHRFSGDERRVDRNHRVAEATMLCALAGIETRPFYLPHLQNERIQRTVPRHPSFYMSRNLKFSGQDEEKKTQFSRIVGALFCPGGAYAVFNARRALMKWNGHGELKVRDNLANLARLNAGVSDVDAAILMGADYVVAQRTMEEAWKNRKLDLRFDGIYPHIFYIPLTDSGAKMLRIMTVPNWQEELLDMLFDPADRSNGYGSFEYDAEVSGTYVLSHLDGDLARLMRFREAVFGIRKPVEVLCYPFQVEFLKACLGSDCRYRVIDIEQVVGEICKDRR